MTMNRIDLIFYVFIAAFAAAASLVLVFVPQSADFALKPVFWILLAMAAFEGVNFAINRGAPGTMISPLSRVLGLIGAFAVINLIVWFAGLNVSLL